MYIISQNEDHETVKPTPSQFYRLAVGKQNITEKQWLKVYSVYMILHGRQHPFTCNEAYSFVPRLSVTILTFDDICPFHLIIFTKTCCPICDAMWIHKWNDGSIPCIYTVQAYSLSCIISSNKCFYIWDELRYKSRHCRECHENELTIETPVTNLHNL